jgi:galactose-1-phosphate uridylyltransferase
VPPIPCGSEVVGAASTAPVGSWTRARSTSAERRTRDGFTDGRSRLCTLEVHILPHRQVPDLAATTGAERDEFAWLYGRLLRGVDALYSTPTPYISAWHQAPVRAHREDIRLMLQLTSPRREETKLKYLAGSEAAMGAFIADIAPEAGAARLREVLETQAGRAGPG